jgi:hypothetical protein
LDDQLLSTPIVGWFEIDHCESSARPCRNRAYARGCSHSTCSDTSVRLPRTEPNQAGGHERSCFPGEPAIRAEQPGPVRLARSRFDQHRDAEWRGSAIGRGVSVAMVSPWHDLGPRASSMPTTGRRRCEGRDG